MSNCKALMDRLSKREREIFSLIVRGYTNLQIAQELSISPATVKIHRSRIYTKFSVDTLKDLFQIFKVRPTAIEIQEE